MNFIKRSEAISAPWYVRFQVDNKPYLWSTKTPDMSLAKKRAKHYREQVIAKAFHLVDGMKARTSTPTFGELKANYLTFPAPSARTKKDNCAALTELLAASCLNDNDTIDRLDAVLATTWQKTAIAKGHPPTTVNSGLRAARSLFSKRAMIHYRPDLKPDPERVRSLFTVPCLPTAQKRPELPTIAADQKAHADLPSKPEVFRAYLLARYGGLRAGEIIAARKDWLDGCTIYIGGREFTAKSRKWRAVTLPQQVVDILLASEHETSLVGDFPGQVVRRQLPAALHACGFPTEKPVHSARRLYGSIVYTDQGPAFARDALGHSTQQVTDTHYARLTTATKSVGFADYRSAV